MIVFFKPILQVASYWGALLPSGNQIWANGVNLQRIVLATIKPSVGLSIKLVNSEKLKPHRAFLPQSFYFLD